jgi:hypothetical protein
MAQLVASVILTGGEAVGGFKFGNVELIFVIDLGEILVHIC